MAKAQFKVGSLSMDKKTFQAYMWNLYTHPDKVNYSCWSCELPPGSIHVPEGADENDARINADINSRKIGVIGNKILVIRKPSEGDFIKWFNKRKK